MAIKIKSSISDKIQKVVSDIGAEKVREEDFEIKFEFTRDGARIPTRISLMNTSKGLFSIDVDYSQLAKDSRLSLTRNPERIFKLDSIDSIIHESDHFLNEDLIADFDISHPK